MNPQFIVYLRYAAGVVIFFAMASATWSLFRLSGHAMSYQQRLLWGSTSWDSWESPHGSLGATRS